MRALLCLLLLAGCSAPVIRNSAQVDLNGAADRAQDNIGDKADAPVPVPVRVATRTTAVAHTRYRCMDGSKIALRFDHQAQTLALSRDGRPVATLSSRTPPSGIWYSNEAWELRGDGEMATLSAPGLPPVACKAIA